MFEPRGIWKVECTTKILHLDKHNQFYDYASMQIHKVRSRIKVFFESKNRTIAFLTGVIVIAATALFLTVRAGGFFVAAETENGTLSGGALLINDTNASGGKAIQFTATSPPPSDGSGLNLPRIPWEGGPAYWSKFSKANAAGWDEPGFFPVSVFLGAMQRANEYKSYGLNTYQAMEHNISTFPLSSVTNTGMFVLAQQEEWTQAEVGNNPNVVSWFISDECEMGYSNCTPDWNHDNGEYGRLAVQKSYVDKVNAYADGRFKHANFGNGVVRTFWAPNTMDDHLALLDSASADKYAYTSPEVDDLLIHSPDWPAGGNPNTAAAYGWQVDQMRSFQNQSSLKSIWGFVETARPLLEEAGARTITPNQMEGAVWSMIIHEARGIGYFMHNNDPGCNEGSACFSAMTAKLTAVNAKIKSLAPVLNTQSYAYNFNNATDTMLKTYGGSAYIFASVGLGENPGSKTFTLPAGINGGTVTVVGENRTIPVNNRAFTDNFASEYTHHVYQIAL